jgi:hypothetical protein
MAAMAEGKQQPARGARAQDAEAERKARQAAALRANLRRRKEQRRGREDSGAAAAEAPSGKGAQ